MPDIKVKSRASHKPTKPLLHRTNPNQTKTKPNLDRTKYIISIVHRRPSDSHGEHWALIIQPPAPVPAPNKPSPDSFCTLYHTTDMEWAETTPYHRIITPDKQTKDLSRVFDRQIVTGRMGEAQLEAFICAFEMTPPQPSAFFIVRLIKNLVRVGLLGYRAVEFIEREVGLEGDGGWRTPEETPGRSPLIFPLEL